DAVAGAARGQARFRQLALDERLTSSRYSFAPPTSLRRGYRCSQVRGRTLRANVVARGGVPRGPALYSAGGGVGRATGLARTARDRLRRARLPADAFPAARLHALGQLLVRRPLQLCRLQHPLLPARGA